MNPSPKAPPPAWLPYLGLGIVNAPGARSPAALVEVARQFDVASNTRYQPRNESTFCNIYCWDVTRAMHAEVPHWVDDAGAPVGPAKGRELPVNGMVLWLEHVGPRYGWTSTDEYGARTAANRGEPSLVTWANPTGGHGHVAVVVPSTTSETLIAQAGTRCFYGLPVSRGFGSTRPLHWWTHA